MADNEEEIIENRKKRGREAFDRAAGFQQQYNPHLGFAMDTAQQGFQNHANAMGAVNSAIDDEMQSRVAQEREMRRMEHEKEMMRMRLEAQRRDEEGNIIRSLLNG